MWLYSYSDIIPANSCCFETWSSDTYLLQIALLMALRRYTASIDGTIPVPALLYDDEELLASQDGVGIYDGCVHFLSSTWCAGFCVHVTD
jgi:hypothetical protein